MICCPRIRTATAGWLAILLTAWLVGCRAEVLGPETADVVANLNADGSDSASGGLGDAAIAPDVAPADVADAAPDPGPPAQDVAAEVDSDAATQDQELGVDAPPDSQTDAAADVATEDVVDAGDAPDGLDTADADDLADAATVPDVADLPDTASAAEDSALAEVQADSGAEVGPDVIPCTAQSCSDGNPCTDDACGPAGCQHTDNSLACDDGSLCTAGDQCAAGACKGTPTIGCCTNSGQCDDKNPCTADSCEAATNTCKLDKIAPAGKPCDSDKDGCTPETCTGGQCAPAAKPNCPGGGTCSAAICTEDGDHLGFSCSLQNKANASACSDGNACTSGDACGSGLCLPGAATNCDDANTCTADSCDGAKGCNHIAKSGPCSDGDACTAETCVAMACAATAVGCDDADACTADSCDKGTGTCVHAPLPCQKPACMKDADCAKGVCDPALHACVACVQDSQCSDATPICQSGVCVAGKLCTKPLDCKATKQLCDLNTKHCVDCEANDDCGPGLACLAQVCIAKIACASNNACPSACDKDLGFCVPCNVDGDCEAGYVCGADHGCHASVCSTGACVAGAFLACKVDGTGFVAAKTCNDGVACSVDSCDKTGGCKIDAVAPAAVQACNDGNACSLDVCDAVKGCQHPAVASGSACDDADACTVADQCAATVCKGAAKACGDGDACTSDTCAAGTCSNVKIVCNDGKECTTDSCAKDSGCKYVAQDYAACNDGDACTVDDYCYGGTCTYASPLDCDSICNNGCTASTVCYSGTCNCKPVSDGTACGTNKTCNNGQCQ